LIIEKGEELKRCLLGFTSLREREFSRITGEGTGREFLYRNLQLNRLKKGF